MHCGRATPTDPGVPPRTMPTGEIEVSKVRRVLADRYRVERVVGEGGMATVYLAEDLKHRRQVALKVMRPELAATLGADRFLREVSIAAQLNHPHVLPMHDSGEAGGVLYYVMPYVEGESLAARLKREGALPVADAVRLAREVAEALAYAHKRGIVHRDIKPANILLSEGHALVADFGIARAVGAEGEAITKTGLAVGTPQYMSPEQATGAKEVDGRTDVYALGAVLYEMITGEPPFTGPTPQSIIARSLTERPRALGSTRDGLPPGLEAVVAQALAKTAADRQPTAAVLVDALRAVERGHDGTTPRRHDGTAEGRSDRPAAGGPWLAAGGVAMAALVAVAFFAGRWGLPAWTLWLALGLVGAGAGMFVLTGAAERRRLGGSAARRLDRWLTWRNAALGGVAAVLGWAVVAAAASTRRTDAAAESRAAGGTHVAVLPFQNQGAEADDYIVDGITDEVRGKLARVSGLAVIASGSANQYRGSSEAPTTIARQLGADYLLTGRVRWAGTADGARRVQVVSELVDGTTGSTTWQQSFEADLTDVFEVQSQIASRVAGALGTQIGSQESRDLARRPTSNPAAWDAYLKGKAVSAVDPISQRTAAAHFEQAVALDSAFVEAWGGLSLTMARVFFNGAREPAVAARSREAFERAIALDPNNAIGHAAAALYYTNVSRDPARSVASLTTAVQLAPNDPDVLAAAGRADVSNGRYESGVARLERARELDPRSLTVLNDLQRGYLATSQYQEAVEVGDAAIALAPSDPGVYEFLAMARAAQGDLPGAQAAARKGMANGISPPTMAAYFAGYFEMTWALDPATEAVVTRLTPAAFDGDRAWWAQSIATAHWIRGRRDLARAYADSGLAPSKAQADAAPSDASPLVLYGLTLAYAGRKEEAVAAGRRAIALSEGQTGSFNAAYDRIQFVRILLAVGELDQAITELTPVVNRKGSYITSAWLRVDPLYDGLRGNPRFERLVAGR
ncbi:MAG TPA: protein kinase [Gemmatimonadales bacterium]|nr:protein kinase [Gemmatimonadales bacterium]